jgi:hypothetical protein
VRAVASQALERREQARFGFKPLEAIEGAQRARLRRIVAHAYETVPYTEGRCGDSACGPTTFARPPTSHGYP